MGTVNEQYDPTDAHIGPGVLALRFADRPKRVSEPIIGNEPQHPHLWQSLFGAAGYKAVRWACRKTFP